MCPVPAIAIADDATESEELGNVTAFVWVGSIGGCEQVARYARQHLVSFVL
jgi:hypothetical protein